MSLCNLSPLPLISSAGIWSSPGALLLFYWVIYHSLFISASVTSNSVSSSSLQSFPKISFEFSQFNNYSACSFHYYRNFPVSVIRFPFLTLTHIVAGSLCCSLILVYSETYSCCFLYDVPLLSDLLALPYAFFFLFSWLLWFLFSLFKTSPSLFHSPCLVAILLGLTKFHWCIFSFS